MIEELQKLQELREKGALTEDEFLAEKQKLMQREQTVPLKKSLGMETNQYLMLMHLSQFANFVMPMAGIAAPIILWHIHKDKSEEIDYHGRAIANWIISAVIYIFVSSILSFVLIGLPFLAAAGIMSFIFPIIGAIKANHNERYVYPLSIPFLKFDRLAISTDAVSPMHIDQADLVQPSTAEVEPEAPIRVDASNLAEPEHKISLDK